MTARIIMALIQTINLVFTVYFWMILVRCLLSWIPNLDIYKQPVASLYAATDWYLNLFRKIIPPFGGIDFSPIVAVFALSLIQYGLVKFILLIVNIMGSYA